MRAAAILPVLLLRRRYMTVQTAPAAINMSPPPRPTTRPTIRGTLLVVVPQLLVQVGDVTAIARMVLAAPVTAKAWMYNMFANKKYGIISTCTRRTVNCTVHGYFIVGETMLDKPR